MTSQRVRLSLNDSQRMALALNIEDWCRRNNTSISGLAVLMNCSAHTVYNWTAMRCAPSLPYFIALIATTERTAEQLLGSRPRLRVAARRRAA